MILFSIILKLPFDIVIPPFQLPVVLVSSKPPMVINDPSLIFIPKPPSIFGFSGL